MSYATGTYTSPVTLLQAIGTWLGGLSGWTVDASVSDGSGWRLHAHKGSMYVHMRAAMNESIWASSNGPGYQIGLYLGTAAYNSGNAWNLQSGGTYPPSQSWVTGVSLSLPGAGAGVSYDLFDDGAGDHIRIVVQHTAGIIGHLYFGSSLAKAGTWGGANGGLYFGGSMDSYDGAYNAYVAGSGLTAPPPGSYLSAQGCANLFVHAGATGFDSWNGWMSNYPSAGQTGYGYMGKVLRSGIPGYATFTSVPNAAVVSPRLTQALTNRTVMHPVRIYADRSVGGVSRIGNIPNVYLSNAVAKGAAIRSVIALGGQNYMHFPNFAVLKV